MIEDDPTPAVIGELARSSIRLVQGHWTWRDKNLGPGMQKTIEEIAGARTVLTSAGLHVKEIRRGDDPPDCEAIVNNELWSIEVTELVDQAWLSNAMKRKKNGQPPPDPFSWTQQALLKRLHEIIEKKDESARHYQRRYTRCALVVLTAETELHKHAVGEFLRGAEFHVTRITDVYLGLDYHGSLKEKGSHPVFRLL